MLPGLWTRRHAARLGRRTGDCQAPGEPEALRRFRAAAPSSKEDAQLLAGCGKTLVGERLAIVDRKRAAGFGGDVGEIWISGPNVAQGYWQNAKATTATFWARIEGSR